MNADVIERQKQQQVKKFNGSDSKACCIPSENPERFSGGR